MFDIDIVRGQYWYVLNLGEQQGNRNVNSLYAKLNILYSYCRRDREKKSDNQNPVDDDERPKTKRNDTALYIHALSIGM